MNGAVVAMSFVDCTKNQKFPDDPFHHSCHQVLFFSVPRYQAQSIWRGRLARVPPREKRGTLWSCSFKTCAGMLMCHDLHHRPRQKFYAITPRFARRCSYTSKKYCMRRCGEMTMTFAERHYFHSTAATISSAQVCCAESSTAIPRSLKD